MNTAGSVGRVRNLLLAVCALFSLHAPSADGGDGDWMARIRPERPRMFVNRQTLPLVKAYAQQHERGEYAAVRNAVNALPLQPDSGGDHGPNAMIAAFMWLMEGDERALEKARSHLLEGIRWYNRQSSSGRGVSHYASSRVAAFTAFDWIHDRLTPKERDEIGRGILQHVTEINSGKVSGEQISSPTMSGFYGANSLYWYAGLAVYGSGVNDAEAASMLRQGYGQHLSLLDFRASAAGDDGGVGQLAFSYGNEMYPMSESMFLQTLQSATGINLAERYHHLSLLANWAYWNFIPPGYRYGFADDQRNNDNRFMSSFLEMHLLNAAHLYGRMFPERASFAVYVRDLAARRRFDLGHFKLHLFFNYEAASVQPSGPEPSWPLSRHFEGMGIVFMRSGRQEGDTHAAYVTGGRPSEYHRHYDKGHFTIHRKGYLALDSGSYGTDATDEHNREYHNRTVAHNTILIRSDSDQTPMISGRRGATKDGGQVSHNSNTLAYQTNDLFTYVASDLSPAYHSGKARQVHRQFVFVPPDHFVVFDKVVSGSADAEKAWLLHTAREPEVQADGKTFRAEHGGGALFSRTLLPTDAKLNKIGGKGREFWSAGRNWRPTGVSASELTGQWRVEVAPGGLRSADFFLHLIQVGDSSSLKQMGPSELVQTSGAVGVKFRAGQTEVVARFLTGGAPGGAIAFSAGSKTVEYPFDNSVQPQTGIAGHETSEGPRAVQQGRETSEPRRSTLFWIKPEARKTVIPGEVAKWDARLIERTREAIRNGKRPSLAVARMQLTVSSVDEFNTFHLTGGGIGMAMDWERFSIEDRRRLAESLLKDDDSPLGSALVAFYLLLEGNNKGAMDLLEKAGEHAAEVEASFVTEGDKAE